jgi:hypothetical protein
MLIESRNEQYRVIRKAKTRSWRNAIAEASKDPRQLWSLEKWARTKSHLKPELPALPPLRQSISTEPETFTHDDKACLLARRFFPCPEADLSDVTDQDWTEDSRQRFQLDQAVTSEEVTQTLRNTGAWKAPGLDLLPTGFLKACGAPLAQAIARIATASLQLEYFPRRFRRAVVVALRKPENPPSATDAGRL